jgi:hypothetical protein
MQVLFYYLKEPKIHLSSLDRAGLANPDYDVHFAFRLENLKTRINSLLYINGNLWDFLAFYDCSEEERRKKETRLFLNDYKYIPGKVWTEVVVDKIDLRWMEFAITYSKKAYDILLDYLAPLSNDLKIYRGDKMRTIIRKYWRIDSDYCELCDTF